ncbi:hypothetical protein [Nitrosomonas sp. Nm33]
MGIEILRKVLFRKMVLLRGCEENLSKHSKHKAGGTQLQENESDELR